MKERNYVTEAECSLWVQSGKEYLNRMHCNREKARNSNHKKEEEHPNYARDRERQNVAICKLYMGSNMVELMSFVQAVISSKISSAKNYGEIFECLLANPSKGRNASQDSLKLSLKSQDDHDTDASSHRPCYCPRGVQQSQ